MTLPLTPKVLRAAYDFLAETAPFNRWNLPDSEDVTFRVARMKGVEGWHYYESKRHSITISAGMVAYTHTLLQTMAHEMIHVHEQHVGVCRSGVEHSAAFKRWAQQVCAVHGFDPKNFC